MEKKGENWELHHMCIVVKDLAKAVKYYQSLGIVTTMKPEFENKDLKLRFVYVNETPYEFVQPLTKESSFQKFLDENGEGLNHLCFFVDDLAKEKAKLIKKGVKFLGGSETQMSFDTREQGNVILELKQIE